MEDIVNLWEHLFKLHALNGLLNAASLLQGVTQGEHLLNVPLRLGIVDQAPDELGDDLLEVSRLALQLLQERSLGESSQRYPWLQVRTWSHHLPNRLCQNADCQRTKPDIEVCVTGLA